MAPGTLVGQGIVFQRQLIFFALGSRGRVAETMQRSGKVDELVIRFGDEHIPLPVDLTITGFEFVPAR